MMRSRRRLLLLLLLAFRRVVASISVSSSDDDDATHRRRPLRRTKKEDPNDNRDEKAQNNTGEWSEWLPSLDEAALGVRFTDAPSSRTAPPNSEADNNSEEDAVVGAEGSKQLYEEDGNPAATTSETVSFCVEPNSNNTDVGSATTISAEEDAVLDLAPSCKLREFQNLVSSNDDSSNNGEHHQQPSHNNNATTNTTEEHDQPSEEPDGSHHPQVRRRHGRNLPQQQHSDTTPNINNATTKDNVDAAAAAFFSGECGPHCRPSCVTLQLNVERYWYHSWQQQNQNRYGSPSPPCRHVRNNSNNRHNNTQQQQQQQQQQQHPTCVLEAAQCFGPVLYDDAAAYVEKTLLLRNNPNSTPPSLPSPLLLLDRCAAIPSSDHGHRPGDGDGDGDGDDLDRLRDWRVVTPVAVRCNGTTGNNATTGTRSSNSSKIEDCFNNEDENILYFEYCHTVHEQALVVPADSSNNIAVNTTTTESCNDDIINSNDGSHQRRTVVVQPFPDGWTSFVVSASIPYHPAALDEPHQQSQLLPHAAATHRACWAQRVDLYFAPRCPHCRRPQPEGGGAPSSSTSLLQLGDRLGALEVVGFGHAIGQPCAPCDRRSHKNSSAATATTELNCRDLQQCERLEDCATGERLGLPNFVENQCSFFDSNDNNTSGGMIDEEQQQPPPDDYEPDANNNDKDNNNDDDDEDKDDNWFSEEGVFVDDNDDGGHDNDNAPSPTPLSDDDGDGDPHNSTCMLLYLQQLQENSSATTLSKQEICEQASSSASETEGSCHFCALDGGHAAPDTIATNLSAVVELCLNDAQYSVLFDDDNTNNTREKLIQCSNIQDDYNDQEDADGSNNTCTRATIQSQVDNDNSNREACWAASPVLSNDTDVNQRSRLLCYYCSLPETGLSICLMSDQAAISQDAGLVCETSISSDGADNDFGVEEAPTSMTNVTDPPSVTTTNETDSGLEDTTVAGSTVVEQQDDAVRQHLLPIVTPIGAALGLALVALLVLLHTQRKRARLTQRELERYRPNRRLEEIVYIDPVELDVIDKVLAPSEEESGFETADESVEIRPTTSDLDERLKNLEKKGEAFSLEVLGESEKPTTAVLKFQSASLVETPGKDEVEALYMTGQHIFTRRRSSGGSP